MVCLHCCVVADLRHLGWRPRQRGNVPSFVGNGYIIDWSPTHTPTQRTQCRTMMRVFIISKLKWKQENDSYVKQKNVNRIISHQNWKAILIFTVASAKLRFGNLCPTVSRYGQRSSVSKCRRFWLFMVGGFISSVDTQFFSQQIIQAYDASWAAVFFWAPTFVLKRRLGWRRSTSRTDRRFWRPRHRATTYCCLRGLRAWYLFPAGLVARLTRTPTSHFGTALPPELFDDAVSSARAPNFGAAFVASAPARSWKGAGQLEIALRLLPTTWATL